MDVKEILNKIIPPDDYQHRNGFSNQHIIDSLSAQERNDVEVALIEELKEKSDMLVIESLAYMKSEKVLPLLYEMLKNLKDGMEKLIIAVSIFEINQDREMIEEAKSLFKNIVDKYQLIAAFHYLIRFRDKEISSIIQEYSTNSDYLISYNAKQALDRL